MDKLTVFMPCYNAEKYLRQAIDSILNQSFSEFKLLIIDDGSTDSSPDILSEYQRKDGRIQVVHNVENRGVTYTRNRGIELCDTEYVALMDADDIAPEKRLEVEIDYLEKHPLVGGVSGKITLMDEAGNMIRPSDIEAASPGQVRAWLLFRNVIANGSAMYRTKVLRNNEIRYRHEDGLIEDYLFWCEFVWKSDFVVLDECTQMYRVNSQGLSQTENRSRKELRDERFDEVHRMTLQLNGIKLMPFAEKAYLLATRENTSCDSKWNRVWLRIALKSMIWQKKKDIEFRNVIQKQYEMWYH